MNITYTIKSLLQDWFQYFKIISLMLLTPFVILIIYQIITGYCYTPSCDSYIGPDQNRTLTRILAVFFEAFLILTISAVIPAIVFIVKGIYYIAMMGFTLVVLVVLAASFFGAIWLVYLVFVTYGFVPMIMTLVGLGVLSKLFSKPAMQYARDNMHHTSSEFLDIEAERISLKDDYEEQQRIKQQNAPEAWPVNENLHGRNPYEND